MGVLARNYEKIYFRENVVVTKNLPTIFPNKSGAQSNTIFWLIDIFFLIWELNTTNSSLQKKKNPGKPIPFFFFFPSFFLQRLKNCFLPVFFRYFGINLVHFRNNSQKLPYSVWSLKCVFQMSLVWHQKSMIFSVSGFSLGYGTSLPEERQKSGPILILCTCSPRF